MRWLATENLQPLLKLWSKEYRVMAPVEEQDDVTLVPYDSEKFTLDYINFFLPVKEYLFAQKDELFKWEKVDDTIPTSSPGEGDFDQQILFGIRACDVYGIETIWTGSSRGNLGMTTMPCGEKKPGLWQLIAWKSVPIVSARRRGLAPLPSKILIYC